MRVEKKGTSSPLAARTSRKTSKRYRGGGHRSDGLTSPHKCLRWLRQGGSAEGLLVLRMRSVLLGTVSTPQLGQAQDHLQDHRIVESGREGEESSHKPARPGL